MSWAENETLRQTLVEQISANAVMAEEGMFTAGAEDIERRANELISQFIAEGHKLENFETVWSCLSSFMEWKSNPSFSFEQATFSFAIERKVGSDVYRLGMEILSFAETPAQRENAYWLLEREVETHFNELFVRLGKPALPPATTAPLSGQELETIPYTAVRHSIDEKGGHRIRMVGGRWQMYGVALYPEEMKKIGWTNDTFGFGETPAYGNMTLLLVDGKPKKVLSVEPTGQ